MTGWLVVLGCRPEVPQIAVDPPLALYGGGDRLAVRAQAFATAADRVGFHDRELDVDCAFETLPGPDGRVRCVPEAATVSDELYADAGCTEPVVTDVAPGDLVHDSPPDACAAEVGWYRAGEPVSPLYAWQTLTGECGEVEGQGLRLEPFDGAAFVAADLVVEPRGPIDAWVARADDGAWEVQSGWDAGLETPVGRYGFGYGASGEIWWPRLYVAYVYDILFADPECSALAAHKIPADAACPVRFGVTFEPGDPPLYRTGEQLDPAGITTRADPAEECVSAGLDGSHDLYFAVGAEVATEELVPIVETLNGAGRIRRRVLSAEDGEPVMLADPPFWDMELGAPCGGSNELPGRGTYCVPPQLATVQYADDRCTEIVAELAESWGDWDAVTIEYDEGLQVRRLGDRLESVWGWSYASGTAQCLLLAADEKEGRVYRVIGDEVPLEELVAGFP